MSVGSNDERLVQISPFSQEIQIHGEVSLKKNVQRLVVWWNQVFVPPTVGFRVSEGKVDP